MDRIKVGEAQARQMEAASILDAACQQFGNISRAELPGRIASQREALERML